MQMSRGEEENMPLPLNPDIVEAFHDLILDTTSSINDVENELISTPLLINSRNHLSKTPLMTVVRSDSPWQRQVQLINFLLKKGASLDTQDVDESHVLLEACRFGVAPEVIDCLLQWNTIILKGFLNLNDQTMDQEGALYYAVRSGSLTLVSYLLSSGRIGIKESGGNAVMKLINEAIQTNHEQMLLLLLQHIEIEENFCSQWFWKRDFDGSNFYMMSPFIISEEDCLLQAYKLMMFEAVCKMAKLSQDATEALWLCWRDSTKHEGELTSVTLDTFLTTIHTTEIEGIAKAYQSNLVYRINSALLPLLVIRSRFRDNDTSGSILSSNGSILNLVVHVADDIFRHIASYCFILDHDSIEIRVKEELVRRTSVERNQEPKYCDCCQGLVLPHACRCWYYDIGFS